MSYDSSALPYDRKWFMEMDAKNPERVDRVISNLCTAQDLECLLEALMSGAPTKGNWLSRAESVMAHLHPSNSSRHVPGQESDKLRLCRRWIDAASSGGRIRASMILNMTAPYYSTLTQMLLDKGADPKHMFAFHEIGEDSVYFKSNALMRALRSSAETLPSLRLMLGKDLPDFPVCVELASAPVSSATPGTPGSAVTGTGHAAPVPTNIFEFSLMIGNLSYMLECLSVIDASSERAKKNMGAQVMRLVESFEKRYLRSHDLSMAIALVLRKGAELERPIGAPSKGGTHSAHAGWKRLFAAVSGDDEANRTGAKPSGSTDRRSPDPARLGLPLPFDMLLSAVEFDDGDRLAAEAIEKMVDYGLDPDLQLSPGFVGRDKLFEHSTLLKVSASLGLRRCVQSILRAGASPTLKGISSHETWEAVQTGISKGMISRAQANEIEAAIRSYAVRANIADRG